MLGLGLKIVKLILQIGVFVGILIIDLKNPSFNTESKFKKQRSNYQNSGLFKKEWSGDGFVGLAAKTYFCFNNTDPSKDKYSSKGLNKSINLTKNQFLTVLETKKASSHKNKGFIMKDKYMYTYEMERLGLPYVYYKRKVLDDGVSTTYLDI